MIWSILAVLAIIAFIIGRFIIVPIMKRRRVLRNAWKCSSYITPSISEDFDRNISVKSNVKVHQTCNCFGFKKRRRFYNQNDIRRLCRHIRKELARSKLIDHFDPLSRRIMRDRIRDSCYKKTELASMEIAFGYHPNSDFVRVFTRRAQEGDPAEGPFSGPYEKFVLDTVQSHWIYGIPPPLSREIIQLVAEMFKEIRGKEEQDENLNYDDME